ncbi:acyl-CoA dehydrogenase family protein, partial [Bowmanella dokdonensis]
VRKQFGLSIGKFEGIQEAMGRIGGLTYTLEAMRTMTAGAIDLGESPSVVTAIAKYHMTEMSREVINDAMDVHAGKGVQLGPKNYLAHQYFGTPV